MDGKGAKVGLRMSKVGDGERIWDGRDVSLRGNSAPYEVSKSSVGRW